MEVIRSTGVEIDRIGRVEEGSGVELHTRDGIKDFEPRFRESAYTPIKKVVDDGPVRDFSEMKEKVDLAAEMAIAKKRRFVERIWGERPKSP